MKYLIVVAHPDDEVLGAGATIKKLVSNGNLVDVCIMSAAVNARFFRPEDEDLRIDMDSSQRILGINRRFEGSFENIKMNVTPHLELVQFIENAIVESEPDVVITHHAADTNNDHLHTSLACQAAIRLFQRREEVKPIKEFWYMEALSSTDWAINSAMNRFTPNLYVEVCKEGLEKKIEALMSYRGVMRDYPHPRSKESVIALATIRGSESGCMYAEAFECVLRRIV